MTHPCKSGIPIQIAVAVMAAASLFVFGYSTGKRAVLRGIKPRVVQVIHRDTIRAYMPLISHQYTHDTIRVFLRDTIHLRDTLYLPRVVREYRDTNYYAVVSGYEPRLDYIETYNTTIIRTERSVVPPPRVSFGVQAGVGAQYGLFRGADFGVYVGVGVNIRLGK